jgi:outer membrane protein OmpA-like peptidoglycan-associated protein
MGHGARAGQSRELTRANSVESPISPPVRRAYRAGFTVRRSNRHAYPQYDLIAVAWVATLMGASAASAEDVKTDAVIVSVQGNQVNARTVDGPLTVMVTPQTSIKQTSGILTKKTRSAKNLIPGLIFTVEGDKQGGTVTATDIRYKESDWHAAVAAKAGTATQFADLRQAIIDGQEYVIRDEATVYFATGSSAIAGEYQQDLRKLAQQAPSYGNYRISILGFTDTTGNPEANQRLSAKRANAVSAYLRQSGLIEPARVLSPSSMGEGTTAPGEAKPASNAEARRVLVRVVTSKLGAKETGAG